MKLDCLISADVAELYLEPLKVLFDKKIEFHIFENSPLELSTSIVEKGLVLITKHAPPGQFYSKATNLQFIQLATAGYESFDIASMKSKNIFLANNGGANAQSVAEHVIMCMLILTRQFLKQELKINNRKWENLKNENRELSGKTLGIVGYGNIGHKVSDIGTAFGMSVLYNDIRNVNAPCHHVRASLTEVFAVSDFVTLHTPLTKSTEGLVNRHSLQAMKKTSFIINTSRGQIVDEVDLAWALDRAVVAGAALDVFSDEPLKSDSPLFDCPNILLTPHCGPSYETSRKLLDNMANNLHRFLNGDELQFEVMQYY